MDLSILFATNTQLDVAHFCIVFPQQRFIPVIRKYHNHTLQTVLENRNSEIHTFQS